MLSKCASVEDLLSMHRTKSNKTTLIPEIPKMINEENVIIASKPWSICFSFKWWISWRASVFLSSY